MNTKSFVNQLDANNVVKGYYDESDQLVMVEPEGSGGGADGLRTVTMTVSEDLGISATMPKIAEGPDGTDYIVCVNQAITAGSYKLASTESGGAFQVSGAFAISGDAELNNGTVVYTGDFTIGPRSGE